MAAIMHQQSVEAVLAVTRAMSESSMIKGLYILLVMYQSEAVLLANFL
jgi:hypothetical protein